MKLSIAALAAAAMAGTASANLKFDPPLAFTQFQGGCDGDVLFEGRITSITMMADSAFCVAEDVALEDGTMVVAYSKIEVSDCTEEFVYEDWSKCEDSACASCVAEYEARAAWDSVNPAEPVGHCYLYEFSTEMQATTRSFNNPMSITFSFNEGVNTADAQAYLDIVDENSCVKNGKPTVELAPPPAEGVDTNMENVEVVEDIAGASALAASAVVGMAAVATALLL